MMEITPSRKTGRPKGCIANYQPQIAYALPAPGDAP